MYLRSIPRLAALCRSSPLSSRFASTTSHPQPPANRTNTTTVTMGFLAGHQLEKKNGEKVDAETALAGKKVVLYFSAAWCGDCTPITAKLATLYEMANEDEDVLEIVWVSADEDKEGMDQYMKKHGDYLHIPYDSPLRSELPQTYGCFGGRHISRYPGVERKNGVPALVNVNKAGDVLNFDCVSDVETKHAEAHEAWGKF